MKQVIITGANGFVGKALTATLLKNNVAVCAVVSNPEKILEFHANPALSVVQASFQDYDTLIDRLPQNADACFHLAWAGAFNEGYHNPALQLSNCDYTRVLANGMTTIGCEKLVFVGSAHQYQCKIEKNQRVGRIRSAYGCAKQCASELCMLIAQRDGFSASTALFPNIYGEGDFSRHFTNAVLLQMIDQVAPKLISSDTPYDCIYIDDAVRGLIAVAEKGRMGEAYYLGNRKVGIFEETVNVMRDTVAPAMKLQYGEVVTSVVTDYTQFDLERAHADLGYEPISDPAESMSKTAAWLRANRAHFL